MIFIQKETLSFLGDLEKHNNREWFDKNRDRYQRAKKDFENFVQQLIDLLQGEWNLGPLDAKDCIYRIFKDVRFSKDKTPYKAEFGATIASGGKKSNEAGVHLYIKPNGQSFIDFGTCHLEPNDLKKIRQEIDYNPAPLKKFIESKTFFDFFNGQIKGEQLKTSPKGYDTDHPEIDLLRYKNFSLRSDFPTSKITTAKFKRLFKETFMAGKPFIDFFNSAIRDT